MSRSMLTRTSSGYKAIKQAASAGFISTYNPPDIMDSAKSEGTTPFLIYTVYVATLGPLLFGYHLVRSMTENVP